MSSCTRGSMKRTSFWDKRDYKRGVTKGMSYRDDCDGVFSVYGRNFLRTYLFYIVSGNSHISPSGVEGVSMCT